MNILCRELCKIKNLGGQFLPEFKIFLSVLLQLAENFNGYYFDSCVIDKQVNGLLIY